MLGQIVYYFTDVCQRNFAFNCLVVLKKLYQVSLHWADRQATIPLCPFFKTTETPGSPLTKMYLSLPTVTPLAALELSRVEDTTCRIDSAAAYLRVGKKRTGNPWEVAHTEPSCPKIPQAVKLLVAIKVSTYPCQLILIGSAEQRAKI
ncbi:hypothetical protein BpHYR1_026489 [Brachionus plicatilis]|uniref:Uncharacterized protein n=1 Tax=Brachionus plicatilis TaxID=10195 RepID=A0A3M7QHY4_BRAPC|nr:hypothetical protein BpHYR1_026489 [Brachionus plicatilis]